MYMVLDKEEKEIDSLFEQSKEDCIVTDTSYL